jgi:hypothetical protein
MVESETETSPKLAASTVATVHEDVSRIQVVAAWPSLVSTVIRKRDGRLDAENENILIVWVQERTIGAVSP